MPVIHFIGPRDVDGYPLQFHEGIPARDLTDDEYMALPDELRAVVRTSGLYDYAGLPEAAQESEARSETIDDPEPAPTETTEDALAENITWGGSR